MRTKSAVSFAWSLLLPLQIIISLRQTIVQALSLQVFPENNHFDPESSDNQALVCDVPLKSTEETRSSYWNAIPDYCVADNNNNNTDETLDFLAKAYAPVLFFHPLERYTMTAVDRIFADPSRGVIINGATEQVFDQSLNLTALLQTTRDPDIGINSDQFYFHHELDEDYVAGDGFNQFGISKAPIYYHALEYENNTLLFTYYIYFSLNGGANLAVISSINGNLSRTDFAAPSYGQHEADWQVIQVLACRSTTNTNPIAVSYHQYSWTEVTDCTAGECEFYKETNRPVAFVALNSHAPHPRYAETILLDNFRTNFLLNLQGSFAVDRTLFLDSNGEYKYFMPNGNNVVRLKEQEEIAQEQDFWQGFAGTWGSSNAKYTNSTPVCIDANQTAYTACPTCAEDEVYCLVLEMIGLKSPSTVTIRLATKLLNSLLEFYPGESPRGPATTVAFTRFVDYSYAPIWNTIGNQSKHDYCTTALDTVNSTVLTPDISVVDLQQQIVGVVFLCVCLMMANIIIYTTRECYLIRRQGKTASSLKYDNAGEIKEPGFRYFINSFRSTIHYTWFYLVTMTGMGLFFYGYRELADILQQELGINLSDIVERWLKIFGIMLIVLDSMFLIIIWIPTNDLFCRVKSAYFDMVGNPEKAQHWEKRTRWGSGWSLTIFRILHGLLFASVIFATFLVVFGCFNIGVAYGMGLTCTSIATSLSENCFSLNIFGFEEIPCGVPFQEFCDSFARKEIVIALWGSFLVASGHYYLVSSAGAASMQFRSILGTLSLLPSSEKYLEGINHLSQLADADRSDRLVRVEQSESVQDVPPEDVEPRDAVVDE